MFITIQFSDKEVSSVNKVAEELGVSGIPFSDAFEDKNTGISGRITPTVMGDSIINVTVNEGVFCAVYNTYLRYVPKFKKLVEAVGGLINAFVSFEGFKDDLRKAVKEAIEEERKSKEDTAA